jgi:outer membrane protein
VIIFMRRFRLSSSWLRRVVGFTFAVCLLGPVFALAQTAQAPNSAPLTLTDAVQLALKNYPGIAESRARVRAADAAVDVAKMAYVPRLDAVWQENRATSNNVFGLLLPQAVIPPISGPVLATHLYDGVWSSAGGVLLSWEAIDFGVRRAAVDASRAQSTVAQARRDLTELEVAGAAADAFLTVLAADEGVRAARANVDRLQVFSNIVTTLVSNQLRPGADQSRANAELAIAKNQVSQATQAAEIARASLADLIGTTENTVVVSAGRLGTAPDLPTLPALDVKTHPAARVDFAAIDAVKARERVLDRSYMPHVNLLSTFSARATGAQVPGLPAPSSAFVPRVPNWAAGVNVTFPALDVFSVGARRRVEVENEAAETAHYDQTVRRLTTQDARARALMAAAVEIASNTPVERQAATEAESRARARYDSGLASITEVAESQRLLAQAEADDALARLGVWRALLAAAQVRGDLAPFLNQVKSP